MQCEGDCSRLLAKGTFGVENWERVPRYGEIRVAFSFSMSALRLSSAILLSSILFATCLGRAQPWGIWFDTKSGPPKPIDTAEKYMKAYRSCDVKGMMALEAPDFKIFTFDGKVINGEKAVGKFHDKRCKRYELGGYGSLSVEPKLYSRDGNAVTYTATTKGDFIKKGSKYSFSESIITAKVAGKDKIAVLISSIDVSKLEVSYKRTDA